MQTVKPIIMMQCERCSDRIVQHYNNEQLCKDCFEELGHKPADAMVCDECGDNWASIRATICADCVAIESEMVH